MYYLDAQRDQDGSSIYKTKTNFNLPLKENTSGIYKNTVWNNLYVCMTSTIFFWKKQMSGDENMDMIRIRSDVSFWIQTKRAGRIQQCLPFDWNDGWENVILCVTTENQKEPMKDCRYYLIFLQNTRLFYDCTDFI